MTGTCFYQGLVRQHQAGLSGHLRVDAAASIVVDALAAFLAIRRGQARGQAKSAELVAAAAAVAALTLDEAGSPPPRAGEIVSCRIEDALDAAAPASLTAWVVGPQGPAWQATIRLRGDVPASDQSISAPPQEVAVPPMRLMRTMGRLHCDQAGHVNVQVFMDLADEAVGVLCRSELGNAPGLQVVQARVSFKQELFEGDVVSVHSGIRSTGAQGVEVVHGIVHQPSGTVACVVETRIAALDATGKPTAAGAAWPGMSGDTPEGRDGEWPALPLARLPSLPRVPERPVEQAVTTALAVVDAWDADEAGWLTVRAMVNLCSTGARQYLARLGLTGERFHRENISVAAVDYLVEVQQRPRLGCNLALRSAYLSGSARSIRFSHHIMDADDGTVYATVEIVGVMLDLATHRSMDVPADVRQRLGLAIGTGVASA